MHISINATLGSGGAEYDSYLAGFFVVILNRLIEMVTFCSWTGSSAIMQFYRPYDRLEKSPDLCLVYARGGTDPFWIYKRFFFSSGGRTSDPAPTNGMKV